MKNSRISRIAFACLAAVAALTTAARGAQVDGRRLYRRHCASCHGFEGRGDGPDAEVFAERPRDLREGFLEKYPTDDLVRRIRKGEPLELALDLPALKARAGEANALVSHLARLPSIDWRTTIAGWEMYTDRCEVCHGRYGVPTKDLPAGVRPPRDLSDPAFQRSIGNEELVAVVRHGRKGMPALTPRIAEKAGPRLVAYVRLLSPGFQLYSRYCASCHGDDGLAGGNPAGGAEMPEVKFDRSYFARSDPQQLYDRVWHMVEEQKPAMPHYRGAISDAQARAIVDYLKSLGRRADRTDQGPRAAGARRSSHQCRRARSASTFPDPRFTRNRALRGRALSTAGSARAGRGTAPVAPATRAR